MRQDFRIEYIRTVFKSEAEKVTHMIWFVPCGIIEHIHMEGENQGISQPAPEKHVHMFYVALILGVFVALISTGLYWIGTKWYDEADKASPSVVAQFPRVKREIFNLAAASAGLGSELYEQAANPVQGELPDAAPPLTNPIEQLYKNPFE
jgi:hypothetical protein